MRFVQHLNKASSTQQGSGNNLKQLNCINDRKVWKKKSSSTLTLNPCTSFNTWKRCKVKIGCAPCCPLTRLVATCSSQQALPVATPLQTLGTLWQTEALLHSALRLENGRIISNQCCIANCIDRYPCCGRSQRVRAMSHVSYYFIHHRLAEFEAHWISRRNRPRLVESYCVIVSCHIMYILCIYYVKRCLPGTVESESEKSDVQVSMNSCRNPAVSAFKHSKTAWEFWDGSQADSKKETISQQFD